MTPYPVIDVKATGENILRRRIERGYTVLDVQRYLNLACPQSVYHWQAGRTLPNIDNFYALSVLFGTSVNDLVAEQNRPQVEEALQTIRFAHKISNHYKFQALPKICNGLAIDA